MERDILQEILDKLKDLKEDVSVIKKDITEIKSDVKYLKRASDEAFKDISILDKQLNP